MLIVVEGMDGGGKSTLIESLRQKDFYFVRVQTSGPPPDQSKPFLLANALRYMTRNLELHVICDRVPFISDRVYGPTLRNIDLFDEMPIMTGLELVDQIIYCRPPREIIRANVERDQHLAGVRERIDELINRYDVLMEQLRTDGHPGFVRKYDFTVDHPGNFWKSVIESLRNKS